MCVVVAVYTSVCVCVSVFVCECAWTPMAPPPPPRGAPYFISCGVPRRKDKSLAAMTTVTAVTCSPLGEGGAVVVRPVGGVPVAGCLLQVRITWTGPGLSQGGGSVQRASQRSSSDPERGGEGRERGREERRNGEIRERRKGERERERRERSNKERERREEEGGERGREERKNGERREGRSGEDREGVREEEGEGEWDEEYECRSCLVKSKSNS